MKSSRLITVVRSALNMVLPVNALKMENNVGHGATNSGLTSSAKKRRHDADTTDNSQEAPDGGVAANILASVEPRQPRADD